MNNASATSPPFIATKEYHRFAEFCEACRQYRYIGVCHGPPGVGKTLSARHYAQWSLIETYFPERFYEAWCLSFIERVIAEIVASLATPLLPELGQCHTVLYTPSVMNTPKRVEQEVRALRLVLRYLVAATQAEPASQPTGAHMQIDPTELLMVDETDRLKVAALEQLRDLFDQGKFGLVLIGMPGLEKRLARYPQLYSRVGFVHEFKALSAEEARFILQHKWQQLGTHLQADDFTDLEAVATIIRMTGGNFRLIQRLCSQIERILQINELRTVTKEVVEAARENLVIGLT